MSCAIRGRLDRLQFNCWAPSGRTPPTLKGFETVWDRFVRRQTSTGTYARCRCYRGVATGTQIFWQYHRTKGWLRPWKVTLVANDYHGLSYDEINSAMKHCRFCRFLIVEIAIDFGLSVGVNANFIHRHEVFGKSRERKDRGGPSQIRFGSRKSNKLVRCYFKDAIDAFRVELEVHSQLLRKNQIEKLDDLPGVAYLISPEHFTFAKVRWRALRHYLKRRYPSEAAETLAQTKKRARVSLRRAMQYLRQKGVVNRHRFLAPMLINRRIENALSVWSMSFTARDKK